MCHVSHSQPHEEGTNLDGCGFVICSVWKRCRIHLFQIVQILQRSRVETNYDSDGHRLPRSFGRHLCRFEFFPFVSKRRHGRVDLDHRLHLLVVGVRQHAPGLCGELLWVSSGQTVGTHQNESIGTIHTHDAELVRQTSTQRSFGWYPTLCLGVY